MNTYKRFSGVVLILAVLLAGISWSATVTGTSLAETTGSIWYVKPDAAGVTCADWENACGLQTALGLAEDGDEIWVAEGVHYPGTASDPRTVTFQLESGVGLYGGFMGTETQRGERDWVAHPTVLSGDIDQDGLLDDGNAYRVVSAMALTSTTTLDGVVITGGYNNQVSHPPQWGGGMYIHQSFVTLRNVILINNYAMAGGGMFIDDCPAEQVELVNVIFHGNSAEINGGGLHTYYYSHPTLTNVTFYDNSAESGSGGGIINHTYSSATLTNAILWGNTPDQINNEGTSTATVSYSDIQGGCPSLATCTEVINVDPLFVDPANGNLRLQRTSPAIDAGDNTAVPTGVTTELDGSPRKVDIDDVVDTGNGTSPFVDMGAYEAQQGAEIIYVDRDAPGPVHDGQSWGSAFTGVQSGLAAAQAGSEVWVAEGTYYPGVIGSRNATFQLKSGVELYGGFEGTEAERDVRDWDDHPAILSGDLDRDGTLENGNAYHVVTGSGVDGTAVLDGFTITGGKADGDFLLDQDRGGGMFNEHSSPTLTDVNFTGNSGGSGGGLFNNSSSPALTNVTFSGNSAGGSGGGLFNSSSSPTLTNVTFSVNSAGWDGGGLYNYASSPALTNVTFTGNSAVEGGGMFNDNSSDPTLTSVTFYDNSAVLGGGMRNWNHSSPTLTNAIVWGNTPDQIYNDDTSTATVSYSDIEDGCPTFSLCTDVINDDPLLGALADNGGSTLTHALPAGSPAIDVGTNVGCPATDQRGMPRPTDGDMDGEVICDMGAVEYQPATTTTITGDAPDPSNPEESFTVTFVVTSTDGIPNGDVTVTVGGETVSCGATLTNGEGNCQLALETPGSYTLTATYAGSAGFETSSDSETHTVIEDTEYPGLLYLPMIWK